MVKLNIGLPKVKVSQRAIDATLLLLSAFVFIIGLNEYAPTSWWTFDLNAKGALILMLGIIALADHAYANKEHYAFKIVGMFAGVLLIIIGLAKLKVLSAVPVILNPIVTPIATLLLIVIGIYTVFTEQ